MQEFIESTPESWRPLLHILLLPLKAFMWTWEGEDMSIVGLKLLLLGLPALLLICAFWSTIISIGTLVFRPQRTKYCATLLVTWLDSGRSVVMFWAGMTKFLFLSTGWIFGALRLIVMGVYQTIKDIVFSPAIILGQMAKNYAKPGIPWIAVTITFLWIALEAAIFSFVLTPLIGDILTGMTNVVLHESIISMGLFVFLFLVVGGSLACMHGLVEAIESKNTVMIIKMILIEAVVAGVEVVFFYREFVEAVIPFFNRLTSEAMEIGPITVLCLGLFAWLGIRTATWFFFAKFGTPTLLMIISREGMEVGKANSKDSQFPLGKPLVWIKNLVSHLQGEIKWFDAKGKEMVDNFFVPPMQIIAVMTNFAMLILTGRTLINIPLKSVEDLKDTKSLLDAIAKNQTLKGGE